MKLSRYYLDDFHHVRRGRLMIVTLWWEPGWRGRTQRVVVDALLTSRSIFYLQ